MRTNRIDNATMLLFQEWFPGDIPHRSVTEKILQTLVLVTTFLLASFGNCAIIFVLCKHFSIKNIPNLLLCILTTLNALITLVNMPFAVISIATDKWIFGEVWCEISGFLNQFLTLTSNAMVTVIALYRYQAIAKTFSAQITYRGVKWITLFAWFYCFVFTIPPFFGWNSYSFSRKKGFCTLAWQNGGSGVVYTILVFIACFLLPFITIIFVYVRIGVITRVNNPWSLSDPQRSSSSVRVSYPDNDVTNDIANGVRNDVRHDTAIDVRRTNDVTTRHRASRTQRLSKRNLSSSRDSILEPKTLSSVSYVMMTFVLFLAPYYVMSIASAISQDSLSATVEFVVAWLHYCHAAAVPFIYGFMNRRIRNVLKQLPWWPKCPGCNRE